MHPVEHHVITRDLYCAVIGNRSVVKSDLCEQQEPDTGFIVEALVVAVLEQTAEIVLGSFSVLLWCDDYSNTSNLEA